MTTIRALGVGEGLVWRDLRLRSLADAPDAFRTLYADVEPWADDAWHQQLDATAIDADRDLLVAEDDAGASVGVAFVSIMHPRSQLGAMWVDPAVRRHGVARSLIDAAIAIARDRGCKFMQLSVVIANDGARQLYESCGFRATGKKEMFRDGSDIEAQKMRCELT